MSERHADQTPPDQPAPSSVGEFHQLIMRCAGAAWRNSGTNISYPALYHLTEAVLREAYGDLAPRID